MGGQAVSPGQPAGQAGGCPQVCFGRRGAERRAVTLSARWERSQWHGQDVLGVTSAPSIVYRQHLVSTHTNTHTQSCCSPPRGSPSRCSGVEGSPAGPQPPPRGSAGLKRPNTEL